MTVTVRKTTPLVDPANDKEAMVMAANMAPARNTRLVKNELLILATAAATFWGKISVANQSVAISYCSLYCDGSCKNNKNQTTATARKTTPPADPANDKEVTAMAANMAPARNARLVKNELLILATAAAMYWGKISVANQSAVLYRSSYCDGSCKKRKTNDSDSNKDNSSGGSCK